MNRYFFRDLIAENPRLLREIIAFNIHSEPVALSEDSLWRSAIKHDPSLIRFIPRKQTASGVTFWEFTSESQRLAFFPPQALSHLGRLVAAAIYAEDIAVSLDQATVTALRAFLGQDIIRYALMRGRYQVGSVRDPLQSLIAPDSLPAKVTVMSRLCLELIRSGWPEPLQIKTQTLFDAIELPALTLELPALSSKVQFQLWGIMKKILLREIDREWTKYFV